MGCSPFFSSLDTFLLLQKDFSMMTFNQPTYFMGLCFYVCLLLLPVHRKFSRHLPDAPAKIFQTRPLERTSYKLRRVHQILKTCRTQQWFQHSSLAVAQCHHTTAAPPDEVQTLQSRTLDATMHACSSQTAATEHNTRLNSQGQI